jgi:hypothetical protein
MSLVRIFALYLLIVSAALLAGSSCATRIGPSAMAAGMASDPAAPEAPIVWPTQVLEAAADEGPDAGPRDASPHGHHHHRGAPHAN